MTSNLNIKSGGDQIYYISKQNESINIEILNIETREKNKLIIDEAPLGMNPSVPVWSNSLQSFLICYSNDSNSDIYSFDKNGKNLKNLTKSEHVFESTPIPSPDGRWIAFERFETKSDIWIMDKDGKNARNLTINMPQNHNPMWSNNSNELYFSSNKEGTPNIFKISLDGTLTNISLGKGVDGTFSLSSDLTKIVFDSDREGNMDIFLMDLVTSEIINLTKSVTAESEPVFSTDNKFILYRTLHGMVFDYSVFNIDTKEIMNLSVTPDNFSGNAIWNNDSSRIYASVKTNNQLDIFSVSIEDKKILNLTNTTKIDEFPPLLVNFIGK